MNQAVGTATTARHRDRRSPSLLDGPVSRLAIWGTIVVVLVAFAATVGTQIAGAYRANPERGRDALIAAAIGVLIIVIAVLGTIVTGAVLQRMRVARVRKQTRDLVYVGRVLPGFTQGLACFSGQWPTKDDLYCFSIGSSGIRFWTGLRSPVMVAAIHWSAIESVQLDRADSRTASYWAANVVASADQSTPLRLVPIEWLSGTLGKRRTTTLLHQLRWHLARRDSY